MGQKSPFCQRLNSSLVECWAVNPAIRVRIWVPPELCSKNKDFFLIIEDKDYSKSRTKIGVSVDTKVWEIAQKLCGIKIIHSQIFDPLTDIWSIHRNFNSRCFKYVWKNQNKCELSQISNWITRWQMIDKSVLHELFSNFKKAFFS